MSIGACITIALIVAGAAYGLSGRDRPRSAPSATAKTLLTICVCIVVGGVLLLLAVMAITANHHPAVH